MKRLRQQFVEERMNSIETPLLQFDEDEFNPKPIVDVELYTNESILSNTNSINDKVQDKSLEVFETFDLFKCKEIDPKFDMKSNSMQKIDFNIAKNLYIQEEKDNKNNNNKSNDYSNHSKLCNVNDLKLIEDKSKPYSSEVFLAIEDNSKFFRNKDLTMFNNSKNTCKVNLLIQKNYIQNFLNTKSITKKQIFYHNMINNEFNNLLNLEDVFDEKSKFMDENDIKIIQICLSIFSSQEENVQKKINKKQKNPLYLYHYDINNDALPISQFLSISKDDKPRNLVRSKAYDLLSKDRPI